MLSFIFLTLNVIFDHYYDKIEDQPPEYLIRIKIILELIAGTYMNIRGFLFFLVLGCQTNVQKELINILLYVFFFEKENKSKQNFIKNKDKTLQQRILL